MVVLMTFGLNKVIKHLDQLSFSRARLKNRLHIYMQKAFVTPFESHGRQENVGHPRLPVRFLPSYKACHFFPHFAAFHFFCSTPLILFIRFLPFIFVPLHLAPFLHYPALHPSPLDRRTESIASNGSPRQHPASRSSSSCRMRQDEQGANKWNRRSCACINHRKSPTSEFWGRFRPALQEKQLCRHVRSWEGGVRMPVITGPTGWIVYELRNSHVANPLE